MSLKAFQPSSARHHSLDMGHPSFPNYELAILGQKAVWPVGGEGDDLDSVGGEEGQVVEMEVEVVEMEVGVVEKEAVAVEHQAVGAAKQG